MINLQIRSLRNLNPIVLCSLILSAFVLPSQLRAADEKKSFYEQLSRGILRLERATEITDNGKQISGLAPNGTAFLVFYKGKNFVVTARHVVSDKYDLLMRFQAEAKDKEVHTVSLILPKDKWVFHPEAGDKNTHPVDVAAMKISLLGSQSKIGFNYDPTGSENQLQAKDPEPPETFLLFGFPGNIGFELLEQKPMGRLGIISMKTGKKFLKIGEKYAEERSILVDTKAFPGNSGSPLFNTSGKEVQLLGLLSASNPDMSYSIIEPVSRIREVIELASKEAAQVLKYYKLEKGN